MFKNVAKVQLISVVFLFSVVYSLYILYYTEKSVLPRVRSLPSVTRFFPYKIEYSIAPARI